MVSEVSDVEESTKKSTSGHDNSQVAVRGARDRSSRRGKDANKLRTMCASQELLYAAGALIET